jgi:GntR family transcriptional regulator / MocR family aminotransferase
VTFHVSLVGRKNLSVEIFRQVRDGIVKGVLRPGERLPATRALAAALKVSRMTVTVAYERLAAEGFVTSRVGDCTRVSRDVPFFSDERLREVRNELRPRSLWLSIALPSALAHSATFDFRTGIPDADLFPWTMWRRLAARTLQVSDPAHRLYGDPAGLPELRRAIARHVAISRGVVAAPDDVTVTNGTQQALDVIARVLLSPGDRVAVEDPGYSPPRRLFESLGARVLSVPVDREGLVVKAIPLSARLIYVTPSHQYPLGMSMTLERRQQLLAWADRHNAAVVEDDYDSEFRFGDRPLEPLSTLDVSGRVVYVGSFSKTLLPSLRLGFLITPASLRAAVDRAKFVADWHTPTSLQAALARFIDEGDFARHVRKVKVVYRERHELVTRTIQRDFEDDLELIPSSTGLHVAALARRASVEQIEATARRAAARGVAVQTLAYFSVGGKPSAGLAVGYGGIETGLIDEGLKRLRRSFRTSIEQA